MDRASHTRSAQPGRTAPSTGAPLRHGQGTLFDSASKSRYEGAWVGGRRHGTGTVYFADGSSAHGEWRDGRPQTLVYSFSPASPWTDCLLYTSDAADE